MSRWEFKLPDIGEGVTDGEIVAWLVQPGDAVTEDQSVVEVMTDKATVTLTAPKAGTVLETRGRVGETVAVHSVLVVFDLHGSLPTVEASRMAPRGHDPPEARANGATTRGPTEGEAHARAVGDIRESLPGLPPRRVSVPSPEGVRPREGVSAAYFNDKPLATPATRKLARDRNIDLRGVRPTGPQGRVTKKDVEEFAPARVASDPNVPERPVPAAAHPAEPASHVLPGRAGLEERIPLAGLRRRIAQRMALATSTAAHFTFVEECDATELMRVRARLSDAARDQGVRLTFLPFIVKAVVAALKRHPMLNAALDETAQEIVRRRYYNIGIATATEAGLVVPVIKDADKRSIVAIAAEIERLADLARAGKARLEDLQGSTFTITSLGAQGGLLATPIINYPEVAILGVHRIKPRPVVKAGQIVIGDVMLLSLSFDHRVVDGHVGAAFAYDVIGTLEQPERLLLEMS
jgi:pyruvate dehydrogenase E2 component (dihydrolipoamide acetyltransferase)